MELKLNIYEQKKVVKTYTAEEYDIMFGTVEDLINILDLDTMQSTDDVEIFKVATKVVMTGLDDIIKPLLKDIFDGLNDEELRHTKVADIAKVLLDVVKFAMAQMSKGANTKN